MGIGVRVTCACGGAATYPLGPAPRVPAQCFFPFLCRACRRMSVSDVTSRAVACDHCGSPDVVPYGHPEAMRAAGPTIVLDCARYDTAWPAASLRLTDGQYFCPACGEFTLSFAGTGLLWD